MQHGVRHLHFTLHYGFDTTFGIYFQCNLSVMYNVQQQVAYTLFPPNYRLPLSRPPSQQWEKSPLWDVLVVTHRSQLTPGPSTRPGTWNHSGEHQPATSMLQHSVYHPEMQVNVNSGGLGSSANQNVFVWEQEQWNTFTESIKIKRFLISSNTCVEAMNFQYHEILPVWAPHHSLII